MKRIAIAAAVVAATALGAVQYASAAGVEFDVGGGGVRIGERHHYDNDWHYRHRETVGYGRHCRVIIRTHINRWGERVRERTRVCD
jgi:hypothetical protein